MTQCNARRKNKYIFTLFKRYFESRKNLLMLKFFFGVYFLLYEFSFGTLLRSRNMIRKLQVRRGERIFEAGCGIGLDCLRIANKHALVVGGDLDTRFKYSSCLGNSKLLKAIDFITMDLRYIPIRSQVFDKITCTDVLEHIDNDYSVVSEFSRVLKNNGGLFVHVPNLMRFAREKKTTSMKARLFARSEYGHVRDGYTLNQLSALFIKNGIQVCDYIYTFGFWSRFASRVLYFSSVFKSEILVFPFCFFMAMLDRGSKTDEYNGGILIEGTKVKPAARVLLPR
jgi:ubiquinone/menaquinone biosynthesis C-methylase UbiE